MILHKLEEIKNASLHDAILITTLTDNGDKYSLVDVYIDPNKECAIEFKGHMSEKDIKLFFFNMNPNITSESSPKNERAEYNLDYSYRNDVTEIYTREGWKYTE